MKTILLLLFVIFSLTTNAQCDSAVIWAEEVDNAVCIETIGNVRYVYANNIPDHGTGTLNGGFTLTALDDEWTMCAEPTIAGSFTQLYGDDSLVGCSTAGSYKFGVGTNGVHYAPSSTDYFQNTSTTEYNYDWNIEAVSAFGVNNQGAHLNPSGQYHYHSIASIYFSNGLGIDGTSHSPIVGYAADGFPIYYKYAYTTATDNSSGISAFDSGWELKTGNRSDDGMTDNDGVSSPNGPYDGYYVEDYEFNPSNTTLDECNGRYGVTPDYPGGTYYYVLTDSWPYIPRCFAGSHVDESFLIGPSASCPDSTAAANCSAVLAVAENDLIVEAIYPNPVVDVLNIRLQIEISNVNETSMILFDANGKTIKKYNYFKDKIDLSYLAAGIYYLQIFNGEFEILNKVVKK